MFLDSSWQVRDGTTDIYMPLIPIRRTVTKKNHVNKFFFSIEKRGPVNMCF